MVRGKEKGWLTIFFNAMDLGIRYYYNLLYYYYKSLACWLGSPSSFSIALVFKLIVGVAKAVCRDYFWAGILILKRADELRCCQETHLRGSSSLPSKWKLSVNFGILLKENVFFPENLWRKVYDMNVFSPTANEYGINCHHQ